MTIKSGILWLAVMNVRDEQLALLEWATQKTGLSYSALAEKAGLSTSTITRFVAKSEMRSLSQLTIKKILEIAGSQSENFNDCHKIPVIGEVPGGQLQEALQQAADDFVYFETRKRNVFALRVRGTSVNRIIPDGGYAVIDANETEPDRLVGQLVVVVFDRGGMVESTCKIYRQNPTRFEPFSTERHDTIFPGNDPWRILGRVFGSVCFMGEGCELIQYPEHRLKAG